MHLRSIVRPLLPLLIATALSSCVSLVKSPKEPTTTFVLAAAETAAPEKAALAPLVLYVPRANAPAYIDSTKIIFSRDDATRNAYQFAQWAEPPPARITALVVAAIEDAHLFAAVTRQASGTSPDLTLNLEILDFRHDAATPPGNAIISIKAELVDLRSGRIRAAQRFETTAPATAFSASGAVAGFKAALPPLTERIISWVAEAR